MISRRLALLLALLAPLAGMAKEIDILRLTDRSEDGFYYLDVDAEIEPGREVREAVASGIPLRFVFDVRVHKVRRYLWNEKLLELRRTLLLERHALAGKYVVTDEASQQRQVASSLDDALIVLGRVRRMAIAREDELNPERPLVGRVRVKLDIESLPAPLRPIAWVSPRWHVSSDWEAWEIPE